MRISRRVASQARSLLGVCCLVTLFLALWPAGQILGQTVSPIVNIPFAKMGSHSDGMVFLFNNTLQPITITDIHVQGVQSQAGFLTTVAGVPPGSFGGDPSTLLPLVPAQATTIQFSDPEALMSGANGQYFVADTGHNLILLYDSRTGSIYRFAGTGTAGFAGDGAPAVSALLNAPRALSRDHSVNLYIADTGNFLVRKVPWLGLSQSGNISTIAGNGSQCTDPTDACGDGSSALSARLGTVLGITHLSNGDLLISDMDACRIRKVSSTDNNIYLYSGDGKCEFSGDGGPAINAGLNRPQGIMSDQLGNIFIADTGNNRVRRIDAITGMITTFAGNGSARYGGDFQPAASVGLPAPRSLFTDYLGNLFIVCGDHAVRKVDVNTGIISTIAGTTSSGYNGDTLAALTQLAGPQGIAPDSAGNLLIADSGNNLLRSVAFDTLNTASEFSLTSTCPDPIAPASYCLAGITFTPATPAVRLAQLVITQFGFANPLIVPISSIGLFSYARIAPSMALTLEGTAGQNSSPQTVLFANSGNVPLNMTSVGLTGDSPGDFLETDDCTAGVIYSYSHCTAQVTFAAPLGATGPSLANLEFKSDALNGTQDVGLAGSSVVQQTTVLTWNTPASIVYGTPLGSKQLSATANGPGMFAYNFAAGTILPAGSQTLTVNFTPADPLQFTSASASVTLPVTLAPLTVTPNNVKIAVTDPIPANLTGTVMGIMNNDPITVAYTTNAVPGVVGTYNITAAPSGNLAPWSNYQATFNVGTLTVGNPLPDLVVTSLTVPGTVTAGATVNVGDTTANNGAAPAGSTSTGFYLSTNPTTNNKWMYLGNRTITSLALGGSSVSSPGPALIFPANVTGSYTFFACANVYNSVTESNSANNCMKAAITINTGVNLQVTGLSYSLASPNIQITDTTANVGTGSPSSSSTAFYLATFVNGVLSNAKWMYLGNRSVTTYPSTATTTWTLPGTLKGTFGVTACANSYKSTLENNYNDNCTTTTTRFTLP